MATVYLGLGTNLGNKEANLRTAIYKLQERIGKQVSLSSFYETAPWGFESDHSFLTGNQSLPYRSASYHAGNRERTRQDKEISQRQLQRPAH